MNYLFFDLEYATSKGGICKICEFGYVLTNDKFDIVKKGNYIINPNIAKSEWDWRVVRKILTRKVYEYERQPRFDEYYDDIYDLINGADIVLGHSLNGDAKALNDECKRYYLESINFTFYDVKSFYKEYNNTKNDTSVTNILKAFNIKGDEKEHDAEADAFNTMLELQAMLDSLKLSLNDLIELCPSARDSNENYSVESIEKSRNMKKAKLQDLINGDNYFSKHSSKGRFFLQFLDNVEPTEECDQVLSGLTFSISINYEENHFRQLLNIVQILCNLGAKYVLKASTANYFVTYESLYEDGSVRPCSKMKYVKEAVASGKDINIISFEEFLKLLHITEEELDNLPMVSFNCLYRKNAVIKDKKIRRIFVPQINTNINREVLEPKLGELFKDFFQNYNVENNR